MLLDHHDVKLTWFIDWPKKEVLFNVDDAFTDDTDWFSFGFSQRGEIDGADICYFVRNIYDESYNEAIVSIKRIMVIIMSIFKAIKIARDFDIQIGTMGVKCLYRCLCVRFYFE